METQAYFGAGWRPIKYLSIGANISYLWGNYDRSLVNRYSDSYANTLARYFLAVDKPAGMLVHPSPQKNSGTLANGVLYHLQQSAAGAGVHPVTRLDRDTFGVVLLAKNANVKVHK